MKLMLLSIEFPPGPGGIGTLAFHLADQMSRRGWEVTVLSPQNYAAQKEVEEFNASQTFEIYRNTYVGPFVAEAADRLLTSYRVALKQGPNIIVGIGEQAVWLGSTLSFLLRRPFLAIGCGTEFSRGSNLRHKMTSFSFGRAKAIVSISLYTEFLMKRIGIKDGDIKVIQPGADSQIFRPDLDTTELRRQLGLEEGRVILTVGQVSKRKGQATVVRALPMILEECGPVTYLIAGIPTRRSEIAKLATELGVRKHVRLLGSVPYGLLPYLYNLADVFVLASQQSEFGDVEGYGIVVVEAALCRTPAVVTDHGGLSETVLDKKTGIIVESNKPAETAAAICRLLKDDQLLQKMGNAAKDYSHEKNTWKNRGEEYHELLDSIVDHSQT